ncbi:lauroyl-Kdo(2)-lipid IV(A) myristoyltransferase [Shewanella sp. MEBiC00475]|uniref:lauroyl-Kdo(2)-lipid IV(A) myristoyltransferase n=1 Tax=Shewanella sp. MEBiC00475 TaxID=2575361 RepID=UPI0010C008AD|nr:lauroyl-Kdo(2)-lipid IV(A) myristoyltransferase [Shewanella sp. MEBiC00475]
MARQAKHFDTRFNKSLLHPRYWGSWLAIGVLFFFGALPASVRDPIARLLARGVLIVAKKPIRIARINITHCFPDMSPEDVDLLIKQNVELFVITLLSQAELLIRSNAHLKRRIQCNGFEHIQAARDAKQPIIFIMPHVWPMEYAGLRVNMDIPIVTMAKAHKNGLFNWFSNRMRSSQNGRVYMREAGIRALLAELKKDNSFFYLPDEDLGPDHSIFTPFLGTVKATLPVVGRLAHAGNAQVMPVKIGYDQQAKQFIMTVMPAINPDEMVGKENEAIALNKAVEQVINAYPAQYMWFLKLLKTRPPGEENLY